MKKIFRFQYEPCLGTCYAPNDQFYDELRMLNPSKMGEIVALVSKAHDLICNDHSMRFGIDQDENTGSYIAHFVTPNRVDLFSSDKFVDVAEQVSQHIIASVAPNQNSLDQGCEFSKEKENLADFIINTVNSL